MGNSEQQVLSGQVSNSEQQVSNSEQQALAGLMDTEGCSLSGRSGSRGTWDSLLNRPHGWHVFDPGEAQGGLTGQRVSFLAGFRPPGGAPVSSAHEYHISTGIMHEKV